MIKKKEPKTTAAALNAIRAALQKNYYFPKCHAYIEYENVIVIIPYDDTHLAKEMTVFMERINEACDTCLFSLEKSTLEKYVARPKVEDRFI